MNNEIRAPQLAQHGQRDHLAQQQEQYYPALTAHQWYFDEMGIYSESPEGERLRLRRQQRQQHKKYRKQRRKQQRIREHDSMMRTQLRSDIERLRRDDPSFTVWKCELPSYDEPAVFQSLRDAMARSSHLEELHLTSKWLLQESVAVEISQGIGKAKALKTLMLCGSDREVLENNHWPIMYQGLRASQSLERLMLSGVPIHLKEIDALVFPKSLRQLVMISSITSSKVAKSFAKVICDSNIETFHLYAANPTRFADWEAQRPLFDSNLRMIVRVIKNSGSVSSIKFCDEFRNGLYVEFISKLFMYFDSSKTSLEVCGQCRFDRATVLDTSTPVSSATRRQFKLEGRQLEDEHVQHLVQSWSTTSTLASLSLSNNRIGPEGTRLLLAAARHRSTLHRLDLSNNRNMGYEALKMIGEDLPNQPYLTEINLDGCAIYRERGDDKAQQVARYQASIALLEGIKQNVHVKSLILPPQWFSSQDIKDELKFYLELNKYGRCLLSSTHRYNLASSVWCVLLAKCQRHRKLYNSIMLFLLREQPDLVRYAASQEPLRKKRRLR